ncbi:terminase small subunit [Komagataeibacter sucrofermentans]|uniref:DNA packaging protein n=1 Tax=Komagataeibacter sucrofermentans TaxID=1053551 RepID=A0A318QKG2_9PROT|nr:terminase small subunit [Komagataeibacter sucrofermentans]PYD79976.1 DNA packaging protein [Komagataeibacter sucrofermentans]GBQ52226.1 phage DNA packing protein [Komagataeibacter sucrofermentans DSM 15973]
MDQPDGSGDTPPVNKRELAKRLRVSLPTLTNWIDRWEDFPVVSRGGNGVSWAFSLEEVFAFLADRREEEAQSKAGRDQQLLDLQLSFDALLPPDPQPAPGSRMSVKEQIDAWKLRDLKRKEAERCGTLVIAADVQEMFTSAVARLSRDIAVYIRQTGREQGWPDAMIRQAEAKLADMQRKSVTDALRALETDEPHADDRQLHLA